MKKEYVKPKMEVVDYSSEAKLLSGSGEDLCWEESEDDNYCD